jgi:hypothetical protein
MEPGRAVIEAQDAVVHARYEQDRTHDARCAHQDQERGGPYIDLQAELP